MKKTVPWRGRVSKGRRAWQIGPVPARPRISFLVPAHNEAPLLGRALESIRGSAGACGLEICETVVCDNASTDTTASIAAASGALVVSEPHRQIARARNAAAAASSGDWLIWLDADAVLTPEVLRGTLGALGSGLFCGGGARIDLEGAPLGMGHRACLALWNAIARSFRLAAGSYFFALREGWTETGGFDEGVYAGEEIGFARALKRWGRPRGLGFRVLGEVVPSSARKAEQFNAWQTARQALICAWPGNLARRDRCAFWYERPAGPS